MLLKIKKTVSILRPFVSFAVALSACLAADGKEDVFHPVRDRAETTSLNGEWDFELAGRRGKIRVPGNWETQGWKTPQYGCVVDDMTGIYRRTFDFSPRWKGRRVVLRFDGVLFGLEVEINGKAVGTNDGASAFNLVQFDITDALREGVNEIVCRVRSRSRTWLCDTNDDWGICGIFRDVEIFSVPREAWIEDVVFTSRGTNWTARVDIGGPSGAKAVAKTEIRGADKCGGIKPWSPEAPNLYDSSFRWNSTARRFSAQPSAWDSAASKRGATAFTRTAKKFSSKAWTGARSIRQKVARFRSRRSTATWR